MTLRVWVLIITLVGGMTSALLTPLPTHAQSWLQQADLANDPSFIMRVKMSAVARAVLIVQGGDDGTPNNNYANRVAFAKIVVANPDAWSRQLAMATAADTTIRLDSTDAVINARVSSIWNTFAGVP